MRTRFAAIAVVAILATLAGGCSTSTKPITQADLAKKLQTDGKVSKAFADCVANELFHSSDKKVLLSSSEKKDFNSQTLSKSTQDSMVRKARLGGTTCKAQGKQP